MATTIAAHQYQAAYDIAVLVDRTELTATGGAERLERESGLNRASARIFINDYRHLIRGERFRRTMSVGAMRYFMERIFFDNGPEVRRNAVQALEAHIAYYERDAEGSARGMRALAEEFALKFDAPSTLEQIDAQFARDVDASLRTSDSDLHARLKANAHTVPKKVVVETTAFIRNPDVVAAALRRANGRCEECGNLAPFARARDGSPYLEVHHDVQLARGGLDILENARALCPNCHRRMHFG
jgi:5-methylcytosine-specific restriction protein A